MNKMKLLCAFLVFCMTMTLQAQTEVMTVYKNDGTSIEFKVADVERVEFSIKDPLVNQYEMNGQVSDVVSVEEVDAVDGYYTYQVYGISENPVLSFKIPTTSINKAINLSEATEADVKMFCDGLPIDESVTGQLKISKDKFGHKLTIELEATWGSMNLEMNYSGSYEKSYAADNQMDISFNNNEQYAAPMGCVLAYKEPTGGATTFVMSDVATKEPSELSNGQYAIAFSLSSAKLYTGKIDLTSNTNSYTLRILDYKNGRVIEADEKVQGEIITYADPKGDENVAYIKIRATLADGSLIDADYYGELTFVSDLSNIQPVPKVSNGFSVTDPTGKVTSQADISTIQVREKNGMTYFYFMKSETDKPDDQMLTPLVVVKSSLINGGVIDLSETEPNTWLISYQAFQLSSPDNEWVNIATNGSLEIKFDGENYEIEAYLLDSYFTPWNQSTVTGSMNELHIYYAGKASAYTGSK